MNRVVLGVFNMPALLAAVYVVAIGLPLAGCQTAPIEKEAVSAPIAPGTEMPVAAAPEDGSEVLADIPLRTAADASAAFAALGAQPTVERLATVIADIDTWFTAPEEQESLRALQNSQIVRLRELVKKEVEAQQARARTASSGKLADEALERAAQSLALYPMSDDSKVIAEAKRLSSRQLDTAAAVESSRRQRYNSAAIDKIESAIKYFNTNPPAIRNAKNSAMIGPIADLIGPIDPFLLEPVVLDLYSSVLQQMNDNLDPEDRVRLAREMTSPARQRKTLRDF